MSLSGRIIPNSEHPDPGLGTTDAPWPEVRSDRICSKSITGRYQAGTSLSGHRAVLLDDSGVLIYADSSTLSHAGSVLGVTLGAISSGESGDIVERGQIVEATWSWTPRAAIYLQPNGVLSQTPPSSGFVCVVGFAMTSTKMYVAVQPPVILA